MEPTAHNHHAGAYHSNPFTVTLTQLSIILKANPISTITLGLLGIAIVVVWYMLIVVLGALIHSVAASLLLGVVGFIVYILIILRVSAASLYIHKASRAGQTVTARQAVKDVAKSNYNKYLLVTLLTGLIIVAGSVAFILPGLWLAGRLLLAPYAALNEGLGVTDSIKRSWQLTRGHWFEMFGAAAAQFVTLPTGLLAFVGVQSGTAGRYYELTSLQQSGAVKPKTHWLNYVMIAVLFLIIGGYTALVTSTIFNANNQHPCNELYGPTSSSLVDCSGSSSPFKSLNDSNINQQNYNYNFDGSN